MRWLVICAFVFGVGAFPLESSHELGDPVEEFSGGGELVRMKRGDWDGSRRMVAFRRRRKTSLGEVKDPYVSVRGLDSKHPYRKKVRPVEKPITPYFVRVLRRKPVGPSAMNYTTNETFSTAEGAEVIDVPRVLVDKRRNKNVDIHPIYVVDDEESQSEDVDFESKPANESYVFVATNTPVSTPAGFEDRGPREISEVNQTDVLNEPRVPVVTFTRVEDDKVEYPDHELNGTKNVDYLPLEYEYEKEPGVQVLEGGDTPQVEGGTQLEVVSHEGPLRLISLRDEQQLLTTTQSPGSEKSIYDTEELADTNTKKRVLPENLEVTDLSASSNSAVYGDYGYKRVVIGGKGVEAEEVKELGSTESIVVSTTSYPSMSTTTTTTTPPPTTTTTAVPTTTTSTTTTTTTTTPPPTTTTTTLSTTTTTEPTTTTTPPPTTTSTTTTPITTTTTTPPPTTTTPTTTHHPQDQTLIEEILNSLPEDDSVLSQNQQTTLQNLILAHILTSTQTPQIPQFTQPHYTNPPDLQTSASTTALFSTRADVSDLPRTTTTRNPILLLFDNLTGNSNQQQRSAEPAPTSIVRPITEENKSDGGNTFWRTMLQLPGNLLRGIVRVFMGLSEMGSNLMSGVVKFMSSLSGGGGGLFGG